MSDLEQRLKNAFRILFYYQHKMRKEIEEIKKKLKELEQKLDNLFKVEDN